MVQILAFNLTNGARNVIISVLLVSCWTCHVVGYQGRAGPTDWRPHRARGNSDGPLLTVYVTEPGPGNVLLDIDDCGPRGAARPAQCALFQVRLVVRGWERRFELGWRARAMPTPPKARRGRSSLDLINICINFQTFEVGHRTRPAR
ncbi:hypothetical protein C7974DRAFT_84583 [Boeremia exigua]|uniref:uncharacterized protein n=1 Tax=Boeremia exigua TaxID=749465 RepID=UPI001E8D3EF8|nr:uncharacterized protein C7974DRAFT_84583 [Boeremia exigua]KAH6612739.1 hypothetical protein C7974DRAFT_84583 [Boeremia exigua]